MDFVHGSFPSVTPPRFEASRLQGFKASIRGFPAFQLGAGGLQHRLRAEVQHLPVAPVDLQQPRRLAVATDSGAYGRFQGASSKGKNTGEATQSV